MATKTWRAANYQHLLNYQRQWHAANRNKRAAYNKTYCDQATPRLRAIGESLVTLFGLLPIEARPQFAQEILNSNSGQTLCWCNSQLEDLIVEHTGQ